MSEISDHYNLGNMTTMVNFNIFRNPFIDTQVSFLLGTLEDARRRETEQYWRNTIVNEILKKIDSIPQEDGGYCHVIHYCDVVELIQLSKGKK